MFECVCVCERERERESMHLRKGEREMFKCVCVMGEERGCVCEKSDESGNTNQRQE